MRARGVAATVAVVGLLGLLPHSAPAMGRVLLLMRGPAPRGAQLLSRELGAWVLPVPGTDRPGSAARILAGRRGVLLAEPDRRWHGAEIAVGCIDQPPTAANTVATLVDAPSPTAPASTIAVLDSGVDPTVPELAGRVLPAINTVGDGDNADRTGHGTAVAGAAAASPGLVRGIAASARILPVKVLDATGSGTTASVVAGIDAAVRHGARVINISVAGQASASTLADDRMFELAIGLATASGAVVTAPTGNNGTNEQSLPSAYPHVLSVAATDLSLQPAPFSDWGPGVDLAAPGEGLVLPAPKAICSSGYGVASGTSFAAPEVAGAAALLTAGRPRLTVGQRFDALLAAAQLATPQYAPFFGAGILDVGQALRLPAPRDDAVEPDDDIFWLRKFPRSHPPVLTPSRRRSTFVSWLGAFDHPADVLRLRLAKGDRLTATATVADGQAPRLVLWDPRAGDFDVSAHRTRHAITTSTRHGSRSSLSVVIRAGGNYYISASAVTNAPSLQRYTLTVARRP